MLIQNSCASLLWLLVESSLGRGYRGRVGRHSSLLCWLTGRLEVLLFCCWQPLEHLNFLTLSYDIQPSLFRDYILIKLYLSLGDKSF